MNSAETRVTELNMILLPLAVSDSDPLAGDRAVARGEAQAAREGAAPSPAGSADCGQQLLLPLAAHAGAAEGAALAAMMAAVLERLDAAEREARKASARIGYLRAEIDRYRDRLRALPQLEARARRAAALELENAELSRCLPELEARARALVSLQKENEELRARLEAPHKAGAESAPLWKRVLSLLGRCRPLRWGVDSDRR